MDQKNRRQLIDRYRAGPSAVEAALAGASEEELGTRPSPDEWSAREVVHHLADSEMRSAIRLRRLIAEDEPTILGYDEGAYARRLYYDRPIGPSLDTLRAVRASTADILDRLSGPQWLRSGTHTESGAYGVERWLEIYGEHAHEHARQIQSALKAARAKAGARA